jgi:hypothetical protein
VAFPPDEELIGVDQHRRSTDAGNRQLCPPDLLAARISDTDQGVATAAGFSFRSVMAERVTRIGVDGQTRHPYIDRSTRSAAVDVRAAPGDSAAAIERCSFLRPLFVSYDGP